MIGNFVNYLQRVQNTKSLRLIEFKQARGDMTNGIDDCIVAQCQRKGADFLYSIFDNRIDDRITTL